VGRLIFSALASLDGYVADEDGDFRWGEPDEEVHEFVNELTRPIGTHLYGRRMYEVLVAWERPEDFGPTLPPYIVDFAEIWQGAEKVVYSRTLTGPRSARTRIEREFDPEAVRAMKEQATQDLAVAGPELAAQAFAAGLVDEVQLFLAPVIVGGGTRALPDGVRLDLELREERRFGNGMVFMRHDVRG
jgi:dihydrofolate reductase